MSKSLIGSRNKDMFELRVRLLFWLNEEKSLFEMKTYNLLVEEVSDNPEEQIIDALTECGVLADEQYYSVAQLESRSITISMSDQEEDIKNIDVKAGSSNSGSSNTKKPDPKIVH